MARADKRLYRPGDESAFADAETDRFIEAAVHPEDGARAGRAGPMARRRGAGLLVAIALVIGLLAGAVGTVGMLALRASTTAGKQDASVPSPLNTGLGTGSNTTQSPSPTTKATPKSTASPNPKSKPSSTTPAPAVTVPKASAQPATVAAPTPVHTRQAPVRFTQPVAYSRDSRKREIVSRTAPGRPLPGTSSARAGENGT